MEIKVEKAKGPGFISALPTEVAWELQQKKMLLAGDGKGEQSSSWFRMVLLKEQAVDHFLWPKATG